ncbi:MAG: CBS domain-containing protein [bacterium]
MNIQYHSLPYTLLSQNALVSPSDDESPSVHSLEDEAVSVLTDFRYVRPFTIVPTATINEINQKMIDCRVRLLFVCANDHNLLGVVTYNDVFSEKPLQYVQEHGGRYEDILVQDIFTPLQQLEALDYNEVLKARVGDIVETYKSSKRQHILVAETRPDGHQVVAGMFSSSQLEKLLGTRLETGGRAHTFADLERALAG